MQTYITQANDALDAICWQHYGSEHGTTEIVLNANPHLADYDAVLPAGVVITLPTLAPPSPIQTQVQLWD